MKEPKYVMIASCPIKEIFIRDMVAKAFYESGGNRVVFNLSTGQIWLGGELKQSWRVAVKGKRVRLEYSTEV